MNYKFKLPSWSIVCCALLGAALVVPIYGQSKLSKQDAELIEAVQGNNLKRVQAALAHGANVNVRDYFGETPLSMAVRFHIGGGYHLTPIKPEDDPARRPGAFAVNEQIEQYLLDHGADIEARDGDGNTLLIRALDRNVREQNLQWVLSHHPNLEVTDNYGNTPLCLAIWREVNPEHRIGIVAYLLDHGANTEAECRAGDTALMIAVETNSMDVAKMLLERGANINARGNDGFTLLQDFAILRNPFNSDMVRFLLEHGANAEVVDDNGNTLLMLAEVSKNTGMVSILKSYQATMNKRLLDQARAAGHCDNFQPSAPNSQDVGLECLRALATQYLSAPNDAVWEAAIRTGMALKPMPTAVPQESRKYFVQANDVFKNSQGDADAKKAIVLYKQALVQAPWFAESWNNLSLVQEKVGDYKGAASSLKNFTLVRPEAANDQVRLDHIYLLEGKVK